jgi:flavin-dependent dehydrogenase
VAVGLHDLVVVGGGPAGLVTAIAARERGLSVVVLDKRTPPIDKACGEGLMPSGVRLLESLGVQVDPADRAPFSGIAWIDGELRAEADFPEGEGLGIRRLHLHEALVGRAVEAGVELRWGQPVTGLRDGGVESAHGVVAGRWVIGADGLNSRVRAWAGLDGPLPARRRFGQRRHFAVAPWSPRVEVHWAEGCEAYVTPVGRERVGVAVLYGGRKARFEERLAGFPELWDRLAAARPDSSVRAWGPLRRRARAVARAPVFLVGDASGYVDAITGEGLSLAFEQGLALARCLAEGTPRRYASLHRRIVRRPVALIEALLWIEQHPRLRRRLVAALSHNPEAFAQLLGLNDGLPMLSLRPATLLRLAPALIRGA